MRTIVLALFALVLPINNSFAQKRNITDHCFLTVCTKDHTQTPLSARGLLWALVLLILVLVDEFVDRAVSFVFFDTLVDVGKIFHEGRFLRNGDVEALLVHKLRKTFEFALLSILL